MKILVCGYHNPNYFTITEYVENAIKKLGYDLVIFDDRKYFFPSVVRENLRFVNEFELNRINNKFFSKVKETKPDIVLVLGGYRIIPEIVTKIKMLNIKIILWTVDVPINFEPILKSARLYDYVFCGGTEAIEIFEKNGIKNVRWLPFGCDEEYHKKVFVSEQEINFYAADISFVGTINPKIYPFRVNVLENLIEYKLGIWGPGKEYLSKNSPIKNLVRGDKIVPQIWRKIYSVSKIVLCVHYKDKNIPCNQASPRVYEALACKSFLIVDKQKDVMKLFKDGRHLVFFDDIKDLKEKINYYLLHKDERDKISQCGYEEVIKKHTYINRVEEILKVVGMC